MLPGRWKAVPNIYMNPDDKYIQRLVPAKQARFADEVIRLKNTEGPWAVIDAILKYWKETHPTRFEAYLIELKDKRDTRLNARGSNRSGSMRSWIDIPQQVFAMIRAIYRANELPMDKKFFREFARRYPVFVVREKD